MIKLFWIFGSDSNLNDSLNALLLLEMTSFSISGHPFSFLSFISSNDSQKKYASDVWDISFDFFNFRDSNISSEYLRTILSVKIDYTSIIMN